MTIRQNMTISAPVPLEARHDRSAFDSRVPEFDDWLKNFAWQAHRSESSKVYVIHDSLRIVGFYALSAGSVRPNRAPARIAKGQGSYDLPIVVLTRLGVDHGLRGKGFGGGLLRDVLVRVASAADIVGARALHAHAKDDRARQFYEYFGFEASPVDPHAMFLVMKDVRALVRG
jgi:GNAT superfamily N-acetyltransferase